MPALIIYLEIDLKYSNKIFIYLYIYTVLIKNFNWNKK